MLTSRTDNLIFDTMAIVGVGLIGGSLGMAAKKNGLVRKVIGLGRTEQKLMRAKILGAIDEYSLDMEKGASEADLIVICTPVQLVVPTLSAMSHYLKKGAVVTDVGSTKQEIVNNAAKIMLDGRFFVGGHPMAGSEKSGVEAAFPDLFLGATYIITDNNNTDLQALGKMTAFVEGIGARAEVMTPEQHDLSAAIISHLPHTMAAALLHVAEDSHRKNGKVFRLAAGSFRDLTRISESSPEMWRDICITNSDSIVTAIDQLQHQLDAFKEALKTKNQDEIMRYFEDAMGIRQTYLRITK